MATVSGMARLIQRGLKVNVEIEVSRVKRVIKETQAQLVLGEKEVLTVPKATEGNPCLKGPLIVN